MPRTRVYEAVTERLEILDTEGRVDEALMPEIDPSRIRDLYRDMVLMRTFDDKALKLVAADQGPGGGAGRRRTGDG